MTLLRLLLLVVRVLAAIWRAAAGRPPRRPPVGNPWLATRPARSDAEWELALQLATADQQHRSRVRQLPATP